MISSMRISFRSQILTILSLTGLFVLGSTPGALAQVARHASAAQARPANSTDGRTIPALLISDIHFDPFNDPSKVQALIAAPVTQWRSILSASPSSDQQQAFDALQKTCQMRGVDTPFTLFNSSLQAMRSRQPDARFVTVSGDLIAHAFSCRYAKLVTGSTPSDYQAFVLKTISFVMAELRTSFPEIPIYVALGNNDTECGDYKLDTKSDFLAQAGKIVLEGLPASQRQQALKEFEEGGYYSTTMAEPMQGARLIVINDLYLSPKYSTCSGKPDTVAATKEMVWLEQQLAQARESQQKVWVMGHIPPGVDPYSTAAKLRNVCAGQAPVMFLSDKLGDLLAQYADVVRLGIFAHTHMDEMRLLRSENSGPETAGEHNVGIKLVPSISPVDGNNPSFTVARVNPSLAVLQNYEVVAASNQTGVAAKWATEYNYGKTYHETQFAPSMVRELIEKFKADHDASTEESRAYIRYYFVGDRSLELSPFWPQYACALDNRTAKAFAACVCSSAR